MIQPTDAKQTVLTHVTPDQFDQPSITTIPEPDLVLRLMGDPHWREPLLNIRGIPDGVEHYLETGLDGLPGNPEGDIDILLCRRYHPEDATAIQVKRIKVNHDSFATGQPTKLRDFQKGVRQANLLSKIGFAQIYLYVFIVVDSWSQNRGEYSYKGLSAELRSTDRVGLIKFDFTQPMNFRPLSIGASGGSLIRLAVRTEQPKEVTEWVAQVCGSGHA